MKGQIVMANYGKSNYWRVENVVFNQLNEKYNMGEAMMTLPEYYKEKYNLTISYMNQPLLEAKNRANENIILVPEFCLMTGMPANID